MKVELTQIFSGFVGTLAFAVLFNIRGKRLAAAGMGGFFSWLLFLLLQRVIPGEEICYFIVALMLSTYAEIMARVLKTPATTFITTSLIPLIPGRGLYNTMTYAYSGTAQDFLLQAGNTLKLAAALAVGIVVAVMLIKLLYKMKKLLLPTACG